MQYHEVKLNIQLASSVTGVSSSDSDLTVQCYVDYVYLDTDERRRFAQVSHEYLISQLQFTGDETVTVSATDSRSQNVRLNLNHPTKFLAFVFKGSAHGQYTAASTSDVANLKTYAEALAPLKSAKLQLNGHDRFSERKGSYFNLVQPWQTLRTKAPAGVYLYSFSLKPDEHQPSGSCNFSRIDNATLNITMKTASSNAASIANIASLGEDVTLSGATSLSALKVFAENYNVFRIMSGINSPVPNSKLPPGFWDAPRGANSGSFQRAAQAA